MKQIMGEKQKEEKEYINIMKKEMFTDNVEAKKEEMVNKKAELLDDLQRSVENSRKNSEMKKEIQINSKIEIQNKKKELNENKINQIESKIEVDSSQVIYHIFI